MSRFEAARRAVLGEAEGRGGIGTLAEKSVHKVLKYYIEPDPAHHEVPYLGSVADIKNDAGIIEIQTRAFEHLVPKLEKFLKESEVTVITPIVAEKYVSTLDDVSGELSSPRKSPKKERIEELAWELSKISKYIRHPNFTFRTVIISASEYRRVKNKRRGEIIDRIPNSIIKEKIFRTPEDYKEIFLPTALGSEFTAAEYASLIKLKSRRAYYGIRLMTELGFVKKIGKVGKAYLYSKS